MKLFFHVLNSSPILKVYILSRKIHIKTICICLGMRDFDIFLFKNNVLFRVRLYLCGSYCTHCHIDTGTVLTWLFTHALWDILLLSMKGSWSDGSRLELQFDWEAAPGTMCPPGWNLREDLEFLGFFGRLKTTSTNSTFSKIL